MFRHLVVPLLCLSLLPAFAQETSPATATLIQQAEAAYKAKKFQESAGFYLRALRSIDDLDRAGTEYNLACSQALAGDLRAALDSLDHAVEHGYSDREHTAVDSDLKGLHSDPRWQPLLERMGRVMAEQDSRWGDAAFATPYATNLPAADKLAGLAELWAEAKYGFANFWHVPELNWDQTYRDFIPQVLASASTDDYYRVLQRFYAQLKDGHSNVYTPAMVSGRVARLALRTRLVDGHLLVVGSRDPSADLQGLHPGDEVLKINDEDAVSWALRYVAPFTSASSIQDLDSRIYERLPFLAAVGTRFSLLVESALGMRSTHTFTVVRDGSSVATPLFALRMLAGNVAYVALNGFDDDTAAKEWDQHWGEISQASAVILDLRENGGGSDEVGSHILATLIDKPVAGMLSRSTRWIATYRAWGTPEIPLRFPVGAVAPDRLRHFAGPIAVLTSARTYSAGEDMAVVFAQAHRGRIVGEPTGGSTGQPLSFRLPGGGNARICTKHDSFADGREFVGVGVTPDIPVHLSRSDIVAGRDTVLERALRLLAESH